MFQTRKPKTKMDASPTLDPISSIFKELFQSNNPGHQDGKSS